jgi:glycosyltransferase involved in cell wall biosynthesis
MMLSFIVPAHNEEHELGRALASIRAAADAAKRPYEIVVADDGSTDRTAAIARAAGAEVVPLNRRHIAAARNAGAAEARGDVLFFVDADTQIAAEHVTGGLAALEAGSVGGGARVRVGDEIPLWARLFISLFCALYFGANLGAGAFLFTTAANFRAVGGFDEQYFAGEEVYFTLALRKLGRFKILQTPILTSGRKLRMHSAAKILGYAMRVMLCGSGVVKSRKHLDLWYDGKRERAA